jgi:flagellar basal-body rod protein FlgF
MIKGVYCSNAGLNAMQHKMDNLANNVANLNTEGFKQQRSALITFKEFVTNVNQIYYKTTSGAYPGNLKNDFSPGTIKETKRELDYAINGEGFFQLKTDQGMRYTRNGSFDIDAQGYLIDKRGNRVQGRRGDIRNRDGQLDQEPVVVRFPDGEQLQKDEEGLFKTEARGITVPDSESKILRGYVETSNVDMVQNFSEMITVTKGLAANARVLTTHDNILKKSTEEVGSLK